MNLNKKLIIVVFTVIFASCSTNNNIQVIDSENIKIEELEKNFNRVIGSGVLQGKGKSNFSSSFNTFSRFLFFASVSSIFKFC